VFHFNREARQATKIVACKWAGTPNKGSGLRAANGEVKAYTHVGLPVQEMRIPDSVLRITRHKGRGIETEHPAVFPVALPEFLMRAYTDEGDVVFEPFAGSHDDPRRPAHGAARSRHRARACLCRSRHRPLADAPSRPAGDAGRGWPGLRRGRGRPGGGAGRCGLICSSR
jgi:hypothetical protein